MFWHEKEPMMENPQFTLSIVIPTLNSERTLTDCLLSIAGQDYPKDLFEVIIADGGSIDSTLEIISAVKVKTGLDIKVVKNRLKTGEAGKAAGLKSSKNEIIAFIDSDNILPDKDWLKKMAEPFLDKDIVASEPIEYTYRATDGYITRYCALLGMNDPLCLFLGNYDRNCTLTGVWTEMPHKKEDRGGYLKIELESKNLPTIGANGFLIRRDALEEFDSGDYLFDIDVLYGLLDTRRGVRFAKVKTGIIHVFSGNIKTFARKQRRRVKDYFYYSGLGVRKYPWKSLNRSKVVKFIVWNITLIPLLAQSLKGFTKKNDPAWFFHPVACWVTLWEYGWGRISGVFGVKELKREGWSQ